MGLESIKSYNATIAKNDKAETGGIIANNNQPRLFTPSSETAGTLATNSSLNLMA